MKTFNTFLKEAEEKHHVLAFGRMNPITSGHEKLVDKVHSVAKKQNARHTVVVSHSQDAKKNPLTGEQKVKHAKRAFPDTNVKSSSAEHPTIMHHASELHKAGVQHLHVIAGSDRKKEMHDLLHKYNGQEGKHGHYNFKSITVHSAGSRDPDAEGTTGMSASKMREHAAAGNKKAFHAGSPSKMSDAHKEEMYNDVRKGMNIKESYYKDTYGAVGSDPDFKTDRKYGAPSPEAIERIKKKKEAEKKETGLYKKQTASQRAQYVKNQLAALKHI